MTFVPYRIANLRLLAGLLILCSGPLSWAGRREAWVEVRSPHFVAYTDAGEAEARSMLKQFEEIRTVFLKAFPKIRVDGPTPTLLLVLRDEASMKQFLPKSFEGKNPKRETGVFYSGADRNYAVVRLDSHFDKPYRVLFHEYTHGITHLNFPGLPLWLDEGIAEFYGTTSIRSDRIHLGEVSKDSLETLRNSVFLPLETLLAVDHASAHYNDGNKTGVFYSQSAMLVHYLFMSPEAQKAGLLSKYLVASDQGADPVEAGRRGFGDLKKLLEALVTYARQPLFTYWTYPISASLSDKTFAARPLDPAQALVVRAEFLQHSNQEPEARPLLEEALKLNPAMPEVHAALGFGHLLRGEAVAAQSQFEEAIQRGSTDFHVYFQAASLREQGTSATDAKRVDYLRRAIELRPTFPQAHAHLGGEYSKDPGQATQALAEMKRAIELDPGNLVHLANLGRIYLNLGQEAEAKALVEPLNARARSPFEKELARQFEEQLQRSAAWRQATTAPATAETPQASPAPAPIRPTKPISFHLSDYLAPLGWEAIKLVEAGKVEEAIQKVKAAKAKAKYAFDKKGLQNLLDQLQAIPMAHPSPTR